ncbi:MAG: response regulator [Planctomycetales bacterium]
MILSDAKSPFTLGGKRILLIDDDKEILHSLQGILEAKGCVTAAADSGQKGLRLAQADPPDLMILDLMMPGTDGAAVLESLGWKTIPFPVIMLTANQSSRQRKTAFRLGAREFLNKPVAINVLLDSIERQLRQTKPIIDVCVSEGGSGHPTNARGETYFTSLRRPDVPRLGLGATKMESLGDLARRYEISLEELLTRFDVWDEQAAPS